jgi:lysophospholipase L1-like esterase
MAVVYCFGDSITYGAWDIQGSGWVARLRRHLDELQEKDQSLYFLSYNLGIPGETTDGLVKRFQTEYLARAKEDGEEESVFFFAFGANDSVFFKSTNEFRVSKDRFVSNLQKVIDSAKSNSKKIALVNIAPADEAVCAERFKERDKVRLNKNVEDYNRLISEIAKTNGLSLVDVYSAFVETDYKKLLSEDGLHPNEKGHQLIFEKVKVVLEKLI